MLDGISWWGYCVSRVPLPSLYIGGRVSRIYKSPIASMSPVSLFKLLPCRTSLGSLVFESVPMIWTPTILGLRVTPYLGLHDVFTNPSWADRYTITSGSR